MGGAVSINARKNDEKTLYMQRIVNDTEALTALFNDITAYGKYHGEISSRSDYMSLAEIILYIEKDINTEFSNHFKGMVEMIKESFYYVVGYKKKIRLEISLKRFHEFMYSMFMFSHLWKVFAAADDNIDDGSIFVGEFIRAKDKICDIEGVRFTQDITDEEWKKEFKRIDHGGEGGGNGWISFREFANYCCKDIVTPEVYCKACGVKRQAEKRGYVGPAKPELKKIEFGGAIQNEITARVPSRKSSMASYGRRRSSAHSKIKSQDSHDIDDPATTTITEMNITEETTNTATKNAISKEKKRRDMSVFTKKSKTYGNRPPRKKNMKKKHNKKSLHSSKSMPVLSDEPMNKIIGDMVTPLVPPPDSDKKDDIIPMDDCSASIDMTDDVIERIHVVTLKKLDDNEKEWIPRTRPLYRPASAGDIHEQGKEYKSWVDKAVIPGANCKPWVPEKEIDGDRMRVPAGFGICGVDHISFAYDMTEAYAEAAEHKKYLTRRKPKGKLWEPKHTTRRFKVMQRRY